MTDNTPPLMPKQFEATQAAHTESPFFGTTMLHESAKLGPFAFFKLTYNDTEGQSMTGYAAVFMMSGDMFVRHDRAGITEWQVPVMPIWDMAVEKGTGRLFVPADTSEGENQEDV